MNKVPFVAARLQYVVQIYLPLCPGVSGFLFRILVPLYQYFED